MRNFLESGMVEEFSKAEASETEIKLARLWAEVLQREAVGPHDDYFELGGNSLLAVSLFTRIENEFGAKLPLTSILEAPTVAEFARLLDTGGSHRPLVLIRKGAETCRLFLVHDAEGETMLYRSLALHLNPELTVFGLQPRSRAGYPILHTRIEEMAEFHIRTIRSVQPHGPYMLGGLCAGALIAFEIARQLQRDGEAIDMVALWDAADVAAKKKSLRIVRQRASSFASTFDQGKADSKRPGALTLARKVLRKIGNLAAYTTQSSAAMVRDETRMRLLRLYLDRGLRLPEFLRDISVRTAYTFARRSYRPGTPYQGELALFRATSGIGDDEPYVDRYSDPLLGWARRATAGVRAYDVPGGHSSMLQEPHVRTMAKDMQAYIDEVLARPTRASASRQSVNIAGSAVHERPDVPGAAVVTTIVADRSEIVSPTRPAQLLVLSATSKEAVLSDSERLADHLAGDAGTELSQVCGDMALERRQLAWRRAVVGGSREQMIERLRAGTGKGVWTGSEPAVKRPVAFVLAGVGEHVAGAGRGLYEGEAAFRDAVDRCADVLKPLLGQDIREPMFTASQPAGNWLRGGAGVIKQTRVAQPAAFVLDWALAEMWMSWGVKPAAVLGYSVGEYAAAAVAGVLELEDALELVARRAQWIEEMAEPGVMLAVPLTEAELTPRLGDGVWVAAVNSPQATVVGGREDAIQRLEEELKQAEVATRRVASEQGSHTPLLDAARDNLRRLTESMRRNRPRIPMLSNVTGRWLTAADAQNADYWCDHMCGTLRFEAGVGELLQNEKQVLLEVGPGAGLGSMVRQHPGCGRERMGRVLASLPAGWDRVTDREHVAGVVGKLWVEGVEIDWEQYYACEKPRRIATPAYSFEQPSFGAGPRQPQTDQIEVLGIAESL